MKAKFAEMNINETACTPVIRSNSRMEWGIAFGFLAVVFQLFWSYHILRGKPYSLCSATECIGFAALVGIATGISLGPLYRLFKIPLTILRFRRPLGVLGAGLTFPHGLISLIFLSNEFPLSFYLKNWSCLLLGSIGVIGFIYLAWISRTEAINRIGLSVWQRRLRWASLLLGISVLHFMVLGKISAWVEWAHQLDKVPPGSIIACGIAGIALFLRLLDAVKRRTLATLSALALLGAFFIGCHPNASSQPKLRVLCGNSMAAPVQELAKLFTRSHSTEIEFDLGGAETLYPKILTGAHGDLFVCHDPFEEKLKAAGFHTETVVLGYLEPLLAVRPGNPKGIHSLADLAKPGLKIGIGNPQFSTCGELFVNVLKEKGLYESVMANVILQARTHAEVANGLILGPLDAVVVWNFVTGLYPGKLEIIPTGSEYPVTRVTLLGLTSSENPTQRNTFLQWCREPLIQETFRRYGYLREKGIPSDRH